MTVNLPFLLLGLALLWFPRHWMRRGVALLRRRRRSSGSERIVDPWKDSEPGDPRVNFRVEFTKVRNYLDLLRALAGGLAIWGGLSVVPALGLGENPPKAAVLQLLVLRCAIVLIGVVIQSVRYEKHRISFYPPIFYLAGLSACLSGLSAAGFAFLLIWSINAGLGNAQAFLSAYALLLGGFGALFAGPKNIPAMLAAGLTFLPVLLSLMAKRPLMIFTRKGSRSPRPA